MGRKLSDAVTSLVVGNWRDAAINALIPLGVMVGLILAVGAIAEASGEGLVQALSEDSNAVGNVLFGTFAYLAMAVGGSLRTTSENGFGDGTDFTYSYAWTPLLASLAGFGLLLYLYLRRARRYGTWSLTTAVVEATRTLLIFLLPLLLAGIFTGRTFEDSDVKQHVSTGSTFGWGLLWTLLTLGVGVLLVSNLVKRPGVTSALNVIKVPGTYLGVFGVAALAGSLIYLLVSSLTLGGDTDADGFTTSDSDATFSDKFSIFIRGLLFLPNLAVNLVSVGMGASLPVPEQYRRFSQFSDDPDAYRSLSLSKLIDITPWHWLLPALLAVLLVAAAAMVAIRQATMPQAQRAVAVFAGLFAVSMLFAAIVSSTLPLPLELGDTSVNPDMTVSIRDSSVGATFGLAILWGLGAALIGLGVAAATPYGAHLRAARPGGQPGAPQPGAPSGPPWQQPPGAPGYGQQPGTGPSSSPYGWQSPPPPSSSAPTPSQASWQPGATGPSPQSGQPYSTGPQSGRPYGTGPQSGQQYGTGPQYGAPGSSWSQPPRSPATPWGQPATATTPTTDAAGGHAHGDDDRTVVSRGTGPQSPAWPAPPSEPAGSGAGATGTDPGRPPAHDSRDDNDADYDQTIVRRNDPPADLP